MRIAISGSHATGKSSLVAELAHRLGDVTAIDEPYYLLEAEGHAFASLPTRDDFATLLERSLSLFAERWLRHVVFDRSPADYLAYLMAVGRDAVSREHVADVASALATLDLVVFVPIERPDRLGAAEAPRLRRQVDGLLHDMLVDGAWAFDVPVVVVRGTPAERADQVQARLALVPDHAQAGRARANVRSRRRG